VFTVETLVGMRETMRDAIKALTQTESSVTSIQSGCELFLRFITLTSLEDTVSKQDNFLLQTLKILMSHDLS